MPAESVVDWRALVLLVGGSLLVGAVSGMWTRSALVVVVGTILGFALLSYLLLVE